MRKFQIVMALGLISASAPAWAPRALAQGAIDTTHAKPVVPAAKGKGPERPAPAAIPGAESRPDEAAPADRAAADLPPTEALFDAINRGDLATAKDAISRGADLDGRNLLNLSPLELSVDLGRNDISFLLLSMRGDSGGGRGRPSVQAAREPTPEPAGRPSRHKSRVAAAPAADTDLPDFAPSTPGVAARAPAAPARQAPALFAGNGGTPQPAAGFVGFDPKH